MHLTQTKPKSWSLSLKIVTIFSAISFSFYAPSTFADSADSCQQSYRFKIKTQTDFDFQGSAITRHQLTGALSLRKLKKEVPPPKTGDWWGLHLTELEQSANNESIPLDPVYKLPFAVLRNGDGRIGEIFFPTKLEKDKEDLLKGFAYYLQFPPKAVSEKRIEEDTIGSITVEYAQSDKKPLNDNVQAINKTKLKYLNADSVSQLNKDQEAFTQISINKSEQRIDLIDCWFDSTRGEESLTFSGTAGSFKMDSDQRYSIVKLPNKVDSVLWTLSDDPNDWIVVEAENELSQGELDALREKFLTSLIQVDLLSLRGSELGVWLTQFDAVIDELGVLILTKAFNDEENMRIFNALGQMDTPKGNELLMTLMSDVELDETNRFRAMRAITQGTKPLTPELTQQMIDLALTTEFQGSPSLRGASIMALGAVIPRREPNEYSDILFNTLNNELTPNKNDNERAAFAASLGNTMDKRAVDTLNRFTNDASDRVRSNVATSLGQIATPEAHQTLSRMINPEEDNKPQQAIVRSLKNFELSRTDLDKVAQIATSSKSERTRGYAIETIAKQEQHAEQAKTILRNMLKSEKSKKNFTKAAKALTQLNLPKQ